MIKDVAKGSKVSVNLVRSIFDTIESVLKRHIKRADADHDVDVCLLKCLHVRSKYQPLKTHNFLGDDIVVSERIKAKAMLSRYYIDEINKKE